MSLRARATTLTLSLALLAGAAVAPVQADDEPRPPVELMDAEQLQAVRDQVGEVIRTQQDSSAPQVERVAGAERYATAAELSTFWSDVVWPEVFTHRYVVVASGESFPDALSGGPLATLLTGPVLLTKKDELPTATKTALERLNPGHIFLLGGTGAVSAGVKRELEQLVTHPSMVSRIDGADRYEVSANVAATWDGAFRVYVASGQGWADGLAGAAAAGADHNGMPLLLTKRDSVPSSVLSAIKRLKPHEIVVVGGTGAVGSGAVSQLEKLAPVRRLSGSDRYATAAAVAREGINYHGATMASGLNWPDALAGSAFAGLTGDKLLLLRPTEVPTATSRAVTDLDLGWITVLGGEKSVSPAVLDALRTLRVEPPTVQ